MFDDTKKNEVKSTKKKLIPGSVLNKEMKEFHKESKMMGPVSSYGGMRSFYFFILEIPPTYRLQCGQYSENIKSIKTRDVFL